jgi:hypothetical protein
MKAFITLHSYYMEFHTYASAKKWWDSGSSRVDYRMLLLRISSITAEYTKSDAVKHAKSDAVKH